MVFHFDPLLVRLFFIKEKFKSSNFTELNLQCFYLTSKFSVFALSSFYAPEQDIKGRDTTGTKEGNISSKI
jgi:hypothetical protein